MGARGRGWGGRRGRRVRGGGRGGVAGDICDQVTEIGQRSH